MKRQNWTTRVVVRYVLLQLPAAALVVLILAGIKQWAWEDMPLWLALVIIALWTAKDAVMFRFTWQAYDWDRSESSNSIIGERGIANERLAPTGYVKVRGELWRARVMGDSPPVDRGEAVLVREVRGLTILVQPDDIEINK